VSVAAEKAGVNDMRRPSQPRLLLVVAARESKEVPMSLHTFAILQSLLLISAANGAPILLKRVSGVHFAGPIDGGLVLPDGHPLLGSSKTWRGIFAGVLLAVGASVAIDLPWQAGALVGASAMVGDCVSSFTKRRFGLESSSMALGIDQIPESLLPAVVCSVYLPLGVLDVVAIVLVFFIGELGLSRLFFAIRLRDRPY
jgi:CDP-diglyceride synthetase